MIRISCLNEQKSQHKGVFELQIYTMQGKHIFTSMCSDASIINLEKFKAGSYLYYINTRQGKTIQKGKFLKTE